VSTESSKIKVPTLADLIERRDNLKIIIDSHRRVDFRVSAPCDDLRDELAQTIGKITELLHEPFEREAVRLREKRQEIAGQLQAAQHQRAQLWCSLGHVQGHRTTALGAGDDATEHTSASRRLSGEVHDLEEHIAVLELRVRGVDGQLTALVERESINIVSGVSAS
jgi:TolA-binding protein